MKVLERTFMPNREIFQQIYKWNGVNRKKVGTVG